MAETETKVVTDKLDGVSFDLLEPTPQEETGLDFTLFEQSPYQHQPVKRQSNAVADYTATGMQVNRTSELGDIEEGISQKDIVKRQQQDTESAMGILSMNNMDVETRMGMARSLVERERLPRTVGEVYADFAFPALPAEIKKRIADDVSVSVRDKENKNIISQMIDGVDQTWDEFMNKYREGLPSVAELAGKEIVDFAKKVEEKATAKREQYKQGNILEPLADSTSVVAGGAADLFVQGSTFGKFDNLKEYIQYINPIEYEDSIDVDWGLAMDMMLEGENPFLELPLVNPLISRKGWNAFLPSSLKTEEGSQTQFATAMASKYGPEWKMRWASYLSKEVGVDALILMTGAAFPRIGEAMFTSSVSLRDRAMTVFNRAIALGIGGGSVQTLMDRIGGDESNLGRDVAVRFGAALVGEGLVKGAQMAWRAGKGFIRTVGDATRSYAREAKLPIYNETITTALRDGTSYKSPISATIIKGNVRELSNEYFRLQDTVAEGVMSARGTELRKQIADLTGVAEERLDIELPLMHRIYNEEFKDVVSGAKQEFGRLKVHAEQLTKEIEGIEPEVKNIREAHRRLLEQHAKRPVKTEAGQAAREAKAKVLGDLLAEREQVLTSKQAELREMQGTISATEGLQLSSGSEIVDKMLQSEAFMFKLMGERTTRQKNVQDMFMTYMDTQQYAFREMPVTTPRTATSLFNPFTYTRKMKDLLRIADPDTYNMSNVAKDLFDSVNKQQKMDRVFGKMLEASTKGVSTKDQALVYKVLQKGNDAERVFTPDELRAEGLTSAKLHDMYYAQRMIMDSSHGLMDSALVKEFNAINPSTGLPRAMEWQGLPMIVDRPPADAPKGSILIRELLDTRAGGSPVERIVQQSEFRPLTNVLPSHTGFIPRAYKNANYHVTMIDKENGAVERIGAFRRLSEAKAFMAEKNKTLGKSQTLVFDHWNDTQQTGFVGFQKGLFNLSDLGSTETIEKIQKALVDELGEIDASKIKIILDKLDMASLRKAHVGARRDEALPGTAQVMETPQAIAEYLHAVSRANGISDWRMWARQEFTSQYRDVLAPGVGQSIPLGSQNMWMEPRQLPLALRSKLRNAKREWDWINRSITHKTSTETKLDNLILSKIADWNVSPNPVMRAASKALDHMPEAIALNNAMRGIAAVPKMLMFSVAQMWVQPTQAVITAGINPIHASGALADIIRGVMPALAKERMIGAIGGRLPKEGSGSHLLNTLRRSGYAADVNTNDLLNTSLGPGNPVVSDIAKLAQFPFKAGEGANRVFAFFTSRREMMERAARGELIGLDGQPFRGAIDDDEFLKLVTNRAKITALNMGRAGQLELFSGPGSWVFQFKQVAAKTLHIFETTELTAAEKFGAGAALVGLWGPQGIPFLSDLVAGGDYAAYQISGKEPSKREFFTNMMRANAKDIADYAMTSSPELMKDLGIDRKTIERFFEKGGINALSDGEIDVVNRLALGRFVGEMIDVQEWYDFVPALGVLADMTEAISKAGLPQFAADLGTAPIASIYMYMDLLGQKGMIDAGQLKKTWGQAIIEHFGEGDGNLQQIIRGAGHSVLGLDTVKEGDATIAEAAYQTMSDFGKTVSYMGSLARITDAVNREDTDETFRTVDPNQPNTFRTSSNRVTSVGVTGPRLISYLFGFTPGKIQEVNDAEKLERMYNNAFKEYTDKVIDKYKNASSNRERQRIAVEVNQELDEAMPMLEMVRKNSNVDWRKSIANKMKNEIIRRNTPITPKGLQNEQ